MERRTVQLRVGGQSHRVVTSASDADLKRFVATLEQRLGEVTPPGRPVPPNALVLVALSLVHDLEEERRRCGRIEARAKDALGRLVERIDVALEDDGSPPPPPVAPQP